MNKFRRLLASALAFGMMLTLVPTANAGYFNDVDSDNVFASFIDHGVAQGYFSTDNSSFYPNNNLSRGELAKIAVVGVGADLVENTEHDFDDVPADSTFYMYVETLLNNLVISPNQYFRPADPVTRGEAAKILVNTFGFELDTTGGPTFSDVGADNLFYSYIETAANNGLVNGYEDGSFQPLANITRAEAAKILAMATGYTGEWGEADDLVLKLSAEEVPVGGSLTFTVKVVDENGSTVQDYDADAEFSVSTGTLSKKTVELINGTATVNYSAPGYGAEGTVNVVVDDFMAEADFSVVIPEDQKMMLYSVDSNIGTTDTTILYLTISDDEGRPVNGQTNDLTFDVIDGDATVGTVSQFPGGADGIYRAILQANAAAVAENVVHVIDNETGDTAELTVNISQPEMEVYLLDPAVSISQETTALVYLTEGDGSPIYNAGAGGVGTLTAAFLNNNFGTTGNVTEIGGAGNGDGWYYVVLTANDETAEAAKVKFSYTGVTPNVHEYASLEIAPYNVSMEILNRESNTLNGVATVVLTFTDVNGQPVPVGPGLALDPVNDIDFDVITAAQYASPTGDKNYDLAGDWFYSHAGLNGIVATQITACGVDSSLCTIDDMDIEVVARIKSATNEVVEVEDTIAFSHPRMDEVQMFDDAGNGVFVVAVMDNNGTGVEGLDVADGAGNGYFNVAGDVAAANVQGLGGGLYIVNSLKAIPAEPAARELTLELGNIDIHDVDVPLEDALGTYVMYGVTSVTEGVDSVATPDVRSSAVFANVNVDGVLAGVNPGLAVTATAEAPITLSDPVASTLPVPGLSTYDIFAADADEIETSRVVIDGENVTFSVRPADVNVTSVDSNGMATEVIYGYLAVTDHNDRLINAEDQIEVDTDGSANDVEVRGVAPTDDVAVATDNIIGFSNGAQLLGLYGIRFERDPTNDDTGEEGIVEYQLNGDDDPSYVDTWRFELVNPSYEVFVQNETTYVAPNSNIGGLYDATNAISILTVVRNDQGVAYDTGLGTISVEVTNGDGLVAKDLDAVGATDTLPDMVNVAVVNGVYYANYLPEDDAEEMSVINVYPNWDDNDESTMFELSVVYPEAQVVVFPTKIDPDKINNEATVLAIVRDNFGNSVTGLDVGVNEDLLVEIEGDQQLTDALGLNILIPTSYQNSNVGSDTIYYGKYTTDEVGIQKIVAKYNDDEVIYEGEIVVEMIED